MKKSELTNCAKQGFASRREADGGADNEGSVCEKEKGMNHDGRWEEINWREVTGVSGKNSSSIDLCSSVGLCTRKSRNLVGTIPNCVISPWGARTPDIECQALPRLNIMMPSTRPSKSNQIRRISPYPNHLEV